MTVILGLTDGTRCWIGSDSGIWSGDSLAGRVANSFKCWKVEDGVVGCAGDAAQLAQFWHTSKDGLLVDIEALYCEAVEGAEDDQTLECLLGDAEGFRWLTKTGYSIPLADTITSLGQSEVAEGALRALWTHTNMAPVVAIRTALGIQARHGSYCQEPFTVVVSG